MDPATDATPDQPARYTQQEHYRRHYYDRLYDRQDDHSRNIYRVAKSPFDAMREKDNR
jgi:hypothetical protein